GPLLQQVGVDRDSLVAARILTSEQLRQRVLHIEVLRLLGREPPLLLHRLFQMTLVPEEQLAVLVVPSGVLGLGLQKRAVLLERLFELRAILGEELCELVAVLGVLSPLETHAVV